MEITELARDSKYLSTEINNIFISLNSDTIDYKQYIDIIVNKNSDLFLLIFYELIKITDAIEDCLTINNKLTQKTVLNPALYIAKSKLVKIVNSDLTRKIKLNSKKFNYANTVVNEVDTPTEEVKKEDAKDKKLDFQTNIAKMTYSKHLTVDKLMLESQLNSSSKITGTVKKKIRKVKTEVQSHSRGVMNSNIMKDLREFKLLNDSIIAENNPLIQSNRIIKSPFSTTIEHKEKLEQKGINPLKQYYTSQPIDNYINITRTLESPPLSRLNTFNHNHKKSDSSNNFLKLPTNSYSKTNPNSPIEARNFLSPVIKPYEIGSGYLSKFNSKKTELRRFYFILKNNKLVYFSERNKIKPKGVINLIRCFIKNEGQINIFNKIYYCFHIYHNINRDSLFCEDKEEYEMWLSQLNEICQLKDSIDNYNLIEFIGQGKFSMVHKGIKNRSQEEVAIKIIRKFKMDKIDLENTRREIAILQICDHNDIIKLKSLYENFEYIYIIQELFSNSIDLYEFMKKNKFNIHEDIAKKIVKRILGVIEYLHKNGIIHRDIKPENILIKIDGSLDIKMIDFGLSRFLGKGDYASNEPFGTMVRE